MRKYLFDYTCKKFNKCPIFWQFTIPSKSYSIWINYHRLNKEFLLKIKNEVLNPKIKFEEEYLREIASTISTVEKAGERAQVRKLKKEKTQTQDLLNDLEDMEKNLKEIIELDLPFDLDDGVVVNIAPFFKLIPWKEPEKTWNNIKEGKLKWSSLSKKLN